MGRIGRLWLKLFRRQKGQGLVFVLIVTSFGALVIGGLLAYASTSLRASGKNTDLLFARYAAEAGAVDVIRDLLRGEDALSPGYTVPTPTVNDLNVTINITSPTPGTEPPAIYQYIDPGTSQGFSSLAGLTHYYFRIDNIRAGSDIRVNWAFTPNDEPWKITLYEGTGPTGVSPPTVIAWDDFESGGWSGGSGWLSSWNHSGLSAISSDGAPYQGTYHLQLQSDTGDADRAVNLTDKSNVRLQFWAKASGFEAGETAAAQVSPDGIIWTTVRTWVNGEDDNVYRFEDIDLSSFAMTSEFRIAFDAGMSASGDYFWVDDLKVVGQPVPNYIAQSKDRKGPGALLVDGALIAGGAYTIDFFNDSSLSVTSVPFSSSGGDGNTWVYAQAHKDYIIASTAENSTLTVYARQIPGPTNPTTGQKVYADTWREP